MAQLTGLGPPPRTTHVMTYDSRRDRVVLFGGAGGGEGLGDTWEFDGMRWARVATDGPPPRGLNAMAYNAARGRAVLLYGGFARQPSNELWELGDSGWRRLAP